MEDLEFAIQVMIVGFTMVLFTLFVLYLIILLLGFFLAPKTSPLSNEPVFIESLSSSYLSEKKIAVISAAVYACLDDCASNYIIKKIEPTERYFVNKWSYEGRKDLINMNREIDKIRRERSGKKVF